MQYASIWHGNMKLLNSSGNKVVIPLRLWGFLSSAVCVWYNWWRMGLPIESLPFFVYISQINHTNNPIRGPINTAVYIFHIHNQPCIKKAKKGPNTDRTEKEREKILFEWRWYYEKMGALIAANAEWLYIANIYNSRALAPVMDMRAI